MNLYQYLDRIISLKGFCRIVLHFLILYLCSYIILTFFFQFFKLFLLLCSYLPSLHSYLNYLLFMQFCKPLVYFQNFQILNSDDHANFLKKQNRNPADYRPDIIHQALLAILDSPLTKAGRLQALYVRTEKGVLFEVKPHVRMPRTFKRFCGLMLHLLQKLSITATGTREKLLNVIKNPIDKHLPVNSRRIGLSRSSEKVVHMRDYVAAASDDINLVFVVGAMAHGKISNESTDDFISISNYPLSAACCLGRICNALEQKWKIL